MKRIWLAGTAILTLIAIAGPVQAAPRHATRYRQAPVQQQWFGSGARIEGVEPGSAAERAGLRAGDEIVGIDGRRITKHSDVDPFVARGGGRPITIEVRRGGALVRLRATPRRGILGYSYTRFCFGCGDPGETYIPPPPIPPDPPPPPPPIISN